MEEDNIILEFNDINEIQNITEDIDSYEYNDIDITTEKEEKKIESPISVPRKLSIHQLIEAERVNSIAPLLEKKPALINSHNKDGYTPLHTACLRGHIDCVKVLIEIGENISPKIDINAKDSTGQWSPLHCAALNGHNECVSILIIHGADINALTSNGCTPLHYAASWGRLETMKILVEAGSRIDQKSLYSGQTPLHMATEKGYSNCVTYLLEQGANVIEVDTIGRSSIDIALSEEHEEIADMLTEYKKMIPWYKKWKVIFCCSQTSDLYSVIPLISNS